MFDFTALNWLAVLVVTVLGFLIGGLWYGPLFGQAWLRAIGKQPEDLGGAIGPLVLSFFTALVTAIALDLLTNATGTATLGGGIGLGLMCGVAFIATGMASDYAFCAWGKPLFFIQSGYRIVYCTAMGAILAIW